jgi:ATP-dependent RNA helicase RhlB
MNFDELNLHADLAVGIAKAGYVTCTPVQEEVLKGVLDGVDLYVQSQTGTGKTAAYLMCIIQQMLANPKMEGKKALIMVPTRELAVQVEEEARTLLSGTKLKTGSFYGGVGYGRQQDILEKGVDILIGTPGRVIDLEESKTMDLSQIGFLVVDEADRMFDMGFYPELRTLIKVLPATSQRQTMLFSATLNTYVKNLAWEYTENAKEITIECDNVTVDEIDQVLLHVSSDDKMKLLLGILKNEKPESTIVFCNTKRSCEVIAKRLKINGIECEFIIGDLPQSKRLQVLESFKRGSLTCLVATDVAARGIDVNELSMVINYDLPNEAENYVHRIGRTARAGRTGKAYTFCSEQDVYNLPAIEKYIEMSIPSSVAGEEMFIEDASKGVYIKTDSYHDEDFGGKRYSDNRSRSRSDNRNGNSNRNNNRNVNRSDSSTGKSRPDNRNNGRPENRNGNQSDKRNNRRPENRNNNRPDYGQNSGRKNYRNNREIDPAIAALPLEERMKLYRQKYENEKAQEPLKNSSKGKNVSGKGYKQSSNNRNRNNNNNPNKYQKKPGTPTQNKNNTKRVEKTAPKSTEKKGLFSVIKKLFGKK